MGTKWPKYQAENYHKYTQNSFGQNSHSICPQTDLLAIGSWGTAFVFWADFYQWKYCLHFICLSKGKFLFCFVFCFFLGSWTLIEWPQSHNSGGQVLQRALNRSALVQLQVSNPVPQEPTWILVWSVNWSEPLCSDSLYFPSAKELFQ